jgi:outer membrane protein OmpA-like peptidoglycan-associated protein
MSKHAFRTLGGLAICATMIAATACTTDPYTGQQRVSKTAVGAAVGAIGGYLLGDVVGGRHDRAERIIGAGIGAVAGGAIGNYMDRQEAELRRETAGTGVDVIRQGDDLLVRMPSGITFDFNSYTVKPQFRSTLDEVARTLNGYNQTYIDVLGHTDSIGSNDYNQRLSEQRAGAVRDYLVMNRVSPVRIATKGYGETFPIADNTTESGRAANRRVEIKIVPVREGDLPR